MGCGAGALRKTGRQDVYLPGGKVEPFALSDDGVKSTLRGTPEEHRQTLNQVLDGIKRSQSSLSQYFASSDDGAESTPSTPKSMRKKLKGNSGEVLSETVKRTKSNLLRHVRFLGDDEDFATELAKVVHFGDPLSRYLFKDKALSRRTTLLIRLVEDRSTGRKRICREHNFLLRDSPGALALTPKQMAEQVLLLRNLNHANIVKTHEIFITMDYIYEIVEFCAGKKLFEHIIAEGKLSDREAANIMHRTLSAVNYMHGKQVCHRDIKPEHIIFEDSSMLVQCQLRIIDFSTACYVADGEVMTRRVTTPHYASPQVFSERYTRLCDLWACGVVMHLILLGYPRREKALQRNLANAELISFVTQGKFQQKPNLNRRQAWDESDEFLSPGAIALLDKLLKPNESSRITASEAVENVWLKLQAQQPNPAESADGVPWSWTPGECADRGGVLY